MALLLKEAEGRGISVSSKERKAYAKNSIGTDDYSEMASSYGVTEDQAKQIVRQSATLQKLYDRVQGIQYGLIKDTHGWCHVVKG